VNRPKTHRKSKTLSEPWVQSTCGKSWERETVEKCIEETQTGDPLTPGRVNIPLNELKGGLAAIHVLPKHDLASFALKYPKLQTLDDGERHLLAWLSAHEKPSPKCVVGHDRGQSGYRRVRRELSRQYDVGCIDPNIEIVDVDLAGDRRLLLRHAVVDGALLQERDAKLVLGHLAALWSYDVSLQEIDSLGAVLKEHIASPRKMAAAA